MRGGSERSGDGGGREGGMWGGGHGLPQTVFPLSYCKEESLSEWGNSRRDTRLGWMMIIKRQIQREEREGKSTVKHHCTDERSI